MGVHLPLPSELLGISKFDHWYPNQSTTFSQVMDWFHSPIRFIGLPAPTGSGKSLIAALTAKLSGARTVILTATKGLQDQILCIAPDTRILRLDLTYDRASSIRVGDKLLGFDETNPTNGHRRMWRESVVESVERVFLPSYRLTLDDGTVLVCSENHMWLSDRVWGGGWRSTKSLRCDRSKYSSKFSRFLPVWDTDLDNVAGYLAAAFDGEGCLLQSDPARGNGSSINLFFSQCENVMLAHVEKLLVEKGFGFTKEVRPAKKSNHHDCIILALRNRPEILHFLGQIRPLRLLERLQHDRLGAAFTYARPMLIKKEFIGVTHLVAIKTSTSTYVAEGLASHNCDFAPVGAVSVKGQNNFRCVTVPTLRCDEGPCHEGYNCSRREGGCPYYEQYGSATRANIVVTNYLYYLAQTRFSDGLGKVDLLICDEAHQLFQALESHLSFALYHMDIEPFGVHFPAQNSSWGDWQDWAKTVTPTIKRRVDGLEEEIRQMHSRGESVPPSLSRALRSARATSRSLTEMSGAAGRWVIQPAAHGYKFAPVWVANYSSLVFRGTPKVMLMSAILSPKTMTSVGVSMDPKNSSWIPVKSSFPPENTPIVHVEAARINHNSTSLELNVWRSRIDQIISRRLDRKGIIFTVSYQRRDLILRGSQYADIMMSHSTQDVIEVVRRFREAAAPRILVSPTVTTGWDFPYVAYIILGKIPFPDASDPVMIARQEEDKDWAAFLAMNTIVQSAGRGSRSITSKSEVLIVDDNWKWFIWRYRLFAPGWFLARLRGSLATVPDPLI